MSAAFETLIARLTDGEPPRVWSFLVTAFGDLAQKEGTALSSAFLTRMTGRIGIKPDANRVALHRLRKEGWVDSQRIGRSSRYLLTDWGRAQTMKASPRIYADRELVSDAWLVLLPQTHAEGPVTGAQIRPGLWLTAAPIEQDDAYCTPLSPKTPLPPWMSHSLVSLELKSQMRITAAAFELSLIHI